MIQSSNRLLLIIILDRKAIACIRQWVDDVVFHHVSNEVSAKSLWKKLHDLFERKTAGTS